MSESESEPLPDTDDPYLLLDVGPDTTARELKRAYTRLVKRFRPEQDPASFQRIVAAYQALRDGSSMSLASQFPASPKSQVETDRSEGPSSDESQQLAEDLRERYERGELTWSFIQSHSEDDWGSLFSELAEFMLLDGSRGELLEIVDSKDFQAALLATREFDFTLFSIAADLYWDDPARAMALVADFPPTPNDDWQWSRLDEAVALAEEWAAVGKDGPLLKEVEESVRLLGMSVDGDTHLLKRLSEQASTAPDRLLESLDRLQRADPYLIIRMQEAVDEHLEPDTRIYQELDPDDRELIDVVMRDIERKLDKNILNGVMGWILLGGIGTGIFAPFEWGWLGLLATVGILVGLVFFVMKVDGALYPRVVRAAILRELVRDGIGVERASEWISANTKFSDNIGRFDENLDEDLSLILLHSLRRYALESELKL